MVKRLSTLVLAGLLALPTAAFAQDLDDLEERIEALEESQESWDLASRIQLNGDIRSRADYHSASTATHYKATNVAAGVYDFYGLNDNFGASAAGFNPTTFGANIGDVLASFGDGTAPPAPVGTCDANCLNDMGGAFAALSPNEAAAMQTMLSMVNPNMTIGQLGGAFANTFADRGNVKPVADFMRNNFTAAQRAAIFGALGYMPTQGADYENDTLYTTRLRLNMRAKATENVEIKARLVGYKVWGMQDSATPETNENGIHETDSPYFLNSRSFDGTSGRQPVDNKLLIDRAFMNWNNIGGKPVWFSIGRRPVTDGPPAHIRMGVDKKLATPINYMDYPFDGLSLGYAYFNLFGIEDMPGRIRLCYGRGFEAGPAQEDTGINDVDFAGISWDIFKKGDRFLGFQSFGAFNIFNVPGDTYFPNPLEIARAESGLLDGSLIYQPTTGKYINASDGSVALDNTYLDRANLGNIYHTSAVYMSKFQDLNYFLTLGWSRTDAKGIDELGVSLMNDFWQEPEDRDGYSVYLGVRYDLDDLGLKFGAEYNYGSKYWLAFTPGHDDMYSSKLQTRGSVYELYTIYDIPGGEAVSKFGEAFIRLGYQHYDYDYTYSGMWLGTPNDIDEIQNDPLSGMFYTPIKDIDNVYLTIEAWF